MKKTLCEQVNESTNRSIDSEIVDDSETLFAYIDDARKILVWLDFMSTYIEVNKNDIRSEIRDNLDSPVNVSWTGETLKIRLARRR